MQDRDGEERNILLVDIWSQIRNVKIDCLENEVNYLRRIVEKNVETPRPLYIDDRRNFQGWFQGTSWIEDLRGDARAERA